MSNLDMLSYTGAITGIIGAVTGIAGAIMGYVGYRRSMEIKALDLRIELRKSISDLSDEIQDLPNILDQAKRSRTAVAAATGRYKSGAMQHWLAQWEADQKSLETFDIGFNELNINHFQDDHATLEASLIEAHSLLTSVRRMRHKCEIGIESDDRERDHIREDIRTRSIAQQDSNPK